jgi:hypothetical protein
MVDITGWRFWLFVLLVAFFIVWLFWRTDKAKYIGLVPYQNKIYNNTLNKEIDKFPEKNLYQDDEKEFSTESEAMSVAEIIKNSANLKPPRKDKWTSYESISTQDKKKKKWTNFNHVNKKSISVESPATLLTSSSQLCTDKLKSPYPFKDIKVLEKKKIQGRPPAVDITPEIPEEVMSAPFYFPQPTADKLKNHDSRKEACCAQILEDIYGKPFVSVRPNFLKNPETQRNIEIDCYNDELQIGLEYQGEQHYHYPPENPKIKMTYDQFIDQIRRDRYKVDACDAAGVYLITVPYNVPEPLLKAYIEYYLPENVARRCNMISSD